MNHLSRGKAAFVKGTIQQPQASPGAQVQPLPRLHFRL